MLMVHEIIATSNLGCKSFILSKICDTKPLEWVFCTPNVLLGEIFADPIQTHLSCSQ